jgi:hypothetical protein
MTGSKPLLAPAFFLTSTLMAQEAKVTPLMSKDLAGFFGKEVLMITVEYPPVGSDPVHRHNAHGFLYVLRAPSLCRWKRNHADAKPELL